MEPVSGQVLQVIPGGIFCDLRTKGGHSGGPVVLTDGELAGLARGYISGPESDGIVLPATDIAKIIRVAAKRGSCGFPGAC